MTCHAFEIVASPAQTSNPTTVPAPEPPNWVGALKDRVTQNVASVHTEVLPEQASPMSEANTETDGTGTAHVRGCYRFDDAESKTTILDALEADVLIDADWYEVRSHTCTHDETSPAACGDWTVERTAGTVPADV